ncbi:uncharacterized protein LOC128244551 [Mya arenaria]|uniref:uncharacterized protein LOC128244551 n=1 Tax=Mya arenaria TaxID=6604 RepID=UPI0022E1CCBA|nr:uncharacterized protein LOC128244551 [Mya arenaria]
MSRNIGYRGHNAYDNSSWENRRDTQGRTQEVFYTDRNNESFHMQPMAPGGVTLRNGSSFPQGPFARQGNVPDNFAPHGNVYNGLGVPRHFFPNDNGYHGHGEPGYSASHGNSYHGQCEQGYSASHGNGYHGHGEPGYSASHGNGYHGHGETGYITTHGIGYHGHGEPEYTTPHGNGYHGHGEPEYTTPHGNGYHGQCEPGNFAPHGNIYHGQGEPGHLAPPGRMPVGHSHAPDNQEIKRDANTPHPGYIVPSMVFIIVKRILSVAVLILNESLNWFKYFDWMGTFDLPAMFGYFGRKGKIDAIECSSDAPFLSTIYGVCCGVATVYALFQIINTIGETVLEYHETDESGERQDELKPKEKRGVCLFNGFQLLHGWVETAAAMIVEDIPQISVIALSSYYCTVNKENAVFLLIWMIVKQFKNTFRTAFCKQNYKPCMEFGNCCKDCCIWSCPLLCCCRVFICRPCDDECCEIKRVKICTDSGCCSGPRICNGFSQACGPIDEDPEWATELLKKLGLLYKIGFVAVIVFQILGLIEIFHYSPSDT